MSSVELVHTQRRDHWQLSRLRDDLNLVWMSRANDWETCTNLSLFLHLIEDRRPSSILPKVRSIAQDIETMLSS